MRALVLNGDTYAVEDRPMPEPETGEVLFRTHYSGDLRHGLACAGA